MYPRQDEIMVPLLRAIARRGGRIVFSDVGDAIERELADHFALSDAQRNETREHINIKGKRVWRMNIQWARKKCIDAGWLDGSVRDVWSLTNAGAKIVQQQLLAAPAEPAKPVLEEESFAEGRELLRLHRLLERNAKLILEKKRQVLNESGNLACEVCGFDFAVVYGTVGKEFAECHHTRPLSELRTERRTTLSELAIVCANCHRMLHRGRLQPLEQLRTTVLALRLEGARDMSRI